MKVTVAATIILRAILSLKEQMTMEAKKMNLLTPSLRALMATTVANNLKQTRAIAVPTIQAVTMVATPTPEVTQAAMLEVTQVVMLVAMLEAMQAAMRARAPTMITAMEAPTRRAAVMTISLSV